MSNATKSATGSPVTTSVSEEAPDQEVLEFRANFEWRSRLDEITREGARQVSRRTRLPDLVLTAR